MTEASVKKVSIDVAGILARLTGTRRKGWSESDGIESGCGAEWFMWHGGRKLDGYVQLDQTALVVEVCHEDDEPESWTWDFSQRDKIPPFLRGLVKGL
jgi:hypothetical protein